MHELEYKQLLMLRDPRDLIMSYVHFALRERLHHHHEYFTTSLTTMTDRITALIEGIDREACPTSPRPPLRNIFEGYLRWIDDDRVLACRYEDLVGARGGGDADAQLENVMAIADAQLENVMAIAEFLERPLTEEQAHGIAKKMYNPRSLTFRAGRVGGWQEHFTPEVWRVFDADFGDMMERLGYRR